MFIKFFLQRSYNYASASFFSTIGEYEDVNKNLKINNCFIIPNGADLSKDYQKIYHSNKLRKKIIFQVGDVAVFSRKNQHPSSEKSIFLRAQSLSY